MKRVLFSCLMGLMSYVQAFDPNESSAVTFEPGRGRFGDQLISYLHASWVSHKTGFPIILQDFMYMDEMKLSDMHEKLSNRLYRRFKFHLKVYTNQQISFPINPGGLYIVPYHSDFRHEAANNVTLEKRHYGYLVVDWTDQEFLEKVRTAVAPKREMPTLDLPDNRVTVAMHVRRGGGYDDRNGFNPTMAMPLKFPTDAFYLDAVRKISALTGGKPLYVHIFSDAAYPVVIAKKYEKELSDLDVMFGAREFDNAHDKNVLEDFYAMQQFDCLIYPESNYSYIPSRIWDYQIRISPNEAEVIDGRQQIVGMQIELKRPSM